MCILNFKTCFSMIQPQDKMIKIVSIKISVHCTQGGLFVLLFCDSKIYGNWKWIIVEEISASVQIILYTFL